MRSHHSKWFCLAAITLTLWGAVQTQAQQMQTMQTTSAGGSNVCPAIAFNHQLQPVGPNLYRIVFQAQNALASGQTLNSISNVDLHASINQVCHRSLL
jgi:hypothetical protein